MARKFQVRGEDRRKRNELVSKERRGGSRRTGSARRDGAIVSELQNALRSLEALLGRIATELQGIARERNPDEITQIPTRNDRLADAVRALSEAQASLLELVRAAKQAARLTPEIRSWVREVAAHAAEVEGRLSRHMAERLRVDAPKQAPRARRLVGRLERLLA